MTTKIMTKTLVKTRHRPAITPEIVNAISNLILAGNYNNVAAEIVGISEGSFYGWLAQGEKDELAGVDSLYLELLKATKNADAKAEAEMVERVRTAAQPGVKSKKTKISPDGQTVEINETGGDWLAAATYLERRHPDRWGRRDRTRVDINETKTITITHVEVVLNEAGRAPAIEGESRELLE